MKNKHVPTPALPRFAEEEEEVSALHCLAREAENA
jgi:hypothetical protein